MHSSLKWKIIAGHWTIKLGRQNGRLLQLDKVQLCEYEKQTSEAFVAVSCLYTKFNCPVARQKFSLLATAHDCETGLQLGLMRDCSETQARSDE